MGHNQEGKEKLVLQSYRRYAGRQGASVRHHTCKQKQGHAYGYVQYGEQLSIKSDLDDLLTQVGDRQESSNNATSDKGMDKDHGSILREGTRNNSKLMKLIAAASSNQIDVLQETELLVQSK